MGRSLASEIPVSIFFWESLSHCNISLTARASKLVDLGSLREGRGGRHGRKRRDAERNRTRHEFTAGKPAPDDKVTELPQRVFLVC